MKTKSILSNRRDAAYLAIALAVALVSASRCPAVETHLQITDQETTQLLQPLLAELQQIKQQQGDAGLVHYLQSLNMGTLDQAEQNETADAISGVALSKPFLGDGRAYRLDWLLEGRHLVRTPDEFKESIALYTLFESLLTTKAADLVDWFATRMTRSPATRADRLIVFLLSGNFGDLPVSYWQTKKAQWDGFLSAKNPAHRLIALQNVRHFEPVRAQLLHNYQSGLHEKNTALQNAAFEGLKLMTGTEPRTMLQGFLNEQHPANDGTMPEGFDINAAVQEYLNPPAP